MHTEEIEPHIHGFGQMAGPAIKLCSTTSASASESVLGQQVPKMQKKGLLEFEERFCRTAGAGGTERQYQMIWKKSLGKYRAVGFRTLVCDPCFLLEPTVGKIALKRRHPSQAPLIYRMIHSLCLISSLFLSAVAQGPPGGQPFRRGPQEVRQEMRPPPSGRPAEMRPPAAQPPAEMRPPAAQPAEGAPPADQPVTEKPTEQPGTNAPFELYENFDMSAVLKLIPRPEDLTWENLLDIRSMLERPQLAFYADKVAFKQFVNQTLELDHARPLFVKNYPESPINATQAMLDIYNAIQGKTNFVAKVTHLADSIGIYVVEDGWNRYVYEGELPKQVRNEDIAKHLSELLLTHYDLTPLGVDTLSHVVPGVVVEERLSLPQDVFPTYGMSEMAALELKCYACWGKLWMCKMRRGPFVYQIIQRDGKPSNRFKASG
eukprot:g16116.t1